MPITPGYCTQRTLTVCGTTYTTGPCGAGSNTLYVNSYCGDNSYPTNQHVVRFSTPGTNAPQDVRVSAFSNTGSWSCATWPAGTELVDVITFNAADTYWVLQLVNSDGSKPTWFEGKTLVVEFKNRSDEPACFAPGVYCPYGTRKKATSPLWDSLTEAGIVAILTAAGLEWWEILLLVFAGQQIDVNKLCSSLPPQPPTPTPDAVDYPPYKLLDYLYQNIWGYYCECVPGTPAPPPPPNGTGTKPDGMPSTRIIVVNPTNPCLDLVEVRRTLDTIVRQLNIDVQLDTLMQRYALPFATVNGAAHSGLSGTGSFAISRLIGVQIVITGRGPNRELEGAPNYVWDLGWISCMDGNGFIQERRITRDVEVWMPREFQEATTLGYVFKAGVTARITELEAEV